MAFQSRSNALGKSNVRGYVIGQARARENTKKRRYLVIEPFQAASQRWQQSA
jgi:hypothetical protein